MTAQLDIFDQLKRFCLLVTYLVLSQITFNIDSAKANQYRQMFTPSDTNGELTQPDVTADSEQSDNSQTPNIPSIPQIIASMKLVGKANLSVWWWDIYDAELYTANGKYQEDSLPLLVSITYNRDIESDALIEETDSQWKRMKVDQQLRENWLTQLKPLWPSVQSGDNISYYIDENGSCLFYFNQTYQGRVSDANFSEKFAAIWLSKESDYPDMTKSLTGR